MLLLEVVALVVVVAVVIVVVVVPSSLPPILPLLLLLPLLPLLPTPPLMLLLLLSLQLLLLATHWAKNSVWLPLPSKLLPPPLLLFLQVLTPTTTAVSAIACYAYCQGFLPCLFLPFRSIHLHFFQNLSRFFPCWLWLTHGSCVGPQNTIGHPAGGRFPCWVPAEYKLAQKTWFVVWWLVEWITWR